MFVALGEKRNLLVAYRSASKKSMNTNAFKNRANQGKKLIDNKSQCL